MSFVLSPLMERLSKLMGVPTEGDPELRKWQALIEDWETQQANASGNTSSSQPGGPSVLDIQDADMRGWLYKKTGAVFKTWERRWVVLKGIHLVMYKSPEATEPSSVAALHNGLAEAVSSETEPPFSFCVTPPHQDRIMFCSKNARRSRQWMDAICIAIEDAVHDSTRRAPLRCVPLPVKMAVRDGIPDVFRGILWSKLSGAAAKIIEAPGRYAVLRTTETKASVRIARDVGRTFPEEEFFKQKGERGQAMLTNVVRAYAVHDDEVGYCQGVNFLTAVLLLHMREEEAFWTLERVMVHYGLRGLFLPHSSQLAVCLYKFSLIFGMVCPELLKHFAKIGLEIEVYTSQWLLTVFAYLFPPELTFRIWDKFFVDGFDVVIRVAVAILLLFERNLLGLNFEESIFFIKKIPESLPSCEQIIRTATSLSWDQSRVHSLVEARRAQLVVHSTPPRKTKPADEATPTPEKRNDDSNAKAEAVSDVAAAQGAGGSNAIVDHDGAAALGTLESPNTDGESADKVGDIDVGLTASATKRRLDLSSVTDESAVLATPHGSAAVGVDGNDDNDAHGRADDGDDDVDDDDDDGGLDGGDAIGHVSSDAAKDLDLVQ